MRMRVSFVRNLQVSKASIFGQVKVLPQKPHSKTASRHLSCKSEETKESTATGNPIEPSKSSNLASTIKRKTEEFVSNLKETFSGEQKETRQNNESELKITKEVEEFSEGKAQDIEIQSQMKQGNRVAYERGEDVWHDSSRLEPLGDVELPEKSLKKDFKKKEIDIHL